MSGTIIGDKVYIRKALPEDASIMCKWYSDREIMKHVGFDKGLSIDPADLQKRIANLNDQNQIYIITDENGSPIGECHYNVIGDEVYDIGIKIGELVKQGQGYGKDALVAFIPYLINMHGVKKITLSALVENKRAINLYSGLGFKVTGINENSWTDPEGRERTSIDMELVCQNFGYKTQ